MGKYLLAVLFSLGICVTMPWCACAQDAAKPAAETGAKPAETAPAANPADIQWLWGEVVSIDAGAKSLVVKYLDYDTDEEKTINISVTGETTFQEVKDFDGIKAQDTVSVEYEVKEGKNCAKDITVEQIDDAAAGMDQAQTVPPEKVGTDPSTEAAVPAQPQN